MISLDGIQAVHDDIRRSSGNYENVVLLYEKFTRSTAITSVSHACTISRKNVDGLYDLLFDCISRNAKIKFRLAVEHQRLYNRNILKSFNLLRLQNIQVAKFLEAVIENYELNTGQNKIYKNLVGHLTRGQERTISCLWQHRALTLFSNGSVGFCAVKSGQIAKLDSQKSIWQQCLEAKTHLDEICMNSCKDCMHDYTGIPDRKELLKRAMASVS
jgi:sulfatase maturation enzyme AslB (radical SAM superfamily)